MSHLQGWNEQLRNEKRKELGLSTSGIKFKGVASTGVGGFSE
jgi:hypothetical protein